MDGLRSLFILELDSFETTPSQRVRENYSIVIVLDTSAMPPGLCQGVDLRTAARDSRWMRPVTQTPASDVDRQAPLHRPKIIFRGLIIKDVVRQPCTIVVLSRSHLARPAIATSIKMI